MSESKTKIEVVISSHSKGSSLVVKHDIKERTKQTMRPHTTHRANDGENGGGSKSSINTTSNVHSSTPRTAVRRPDSKVGTPRTPATTQVNSTPAATPRTPLSSAMAESTPRTPSATNAAECVTPSSVSTSRNNTPGVGRTPLLPTGPRTPMNNTPRHGAPLPKRFRKDDENRSASQPRRGVQRSKSIRDTDILKKDEDVRRKDNFPRVLSSSSINVPSPRVSGSRLSGDPRTPTITRTPAGRSSGVSKVSMDSNTPVNRSARRSQSSLSRYTSLLSDPPQTSSGDFLTPDIGLRRSSIMPVSPGAEELFDGTESTAVSVGVRIRPLSTREQNTDTKNVVEVVDNSIQLQSENGTAHTFSYDHCFWSCDNQHPKFASQEMVYSTLAKPLLEKSFEGYNTCLFAYGQTGSGKSFTMLGEDSDEDPECEAPASTGVIPRFCRDLFSRADYIHFNNPSEDQLPQTRLEVEVSYIEIYNERIYDLLTSGGCSGERREALRVREHPEDGPYVEGVARHLVSSYNHLQTWMLLGNKERSIAATGMNDKSSRSHAVFTLKLTQMQVEDVEGERLESSRVSIINLVDLAGSERVAATHSQGERLKEGVCINKSLLTLGKVITALAESAGRKRPFIPYRESVLTYLLKESLGGNSRTAMIATISPCSVHIEETLSTLRYAQQARKIVNRNHINEDPTARIIRSLKEEVERLRRHHLVKSPSMLFEADVSEESEKGDDLNEEKEKEREEALQNMKREKERAVKEKEEVISSLKDQLQLQYQLQQQQLADKSRSFEKRLRENEERQTEALEQQRLMGIASQKEKGPKLINLSEDPQLSETLSYLLKDGTTNIGRSHCDLTLHGLHSNNVHCSIFNDDGSLTLFPKTDTETYVNGKLALTPTPLQHNDRLILTGIYYFRLNIPNEVTDLNKEAALKYDFYYTNQELLREQEKRLKEEAEAKLAANKEELERQMSLQRDQLMEEVNEARTQLFCKQQLVCEMEGTQWKLEEEKRLLEGQIKRDRKLMKSLDVSLQHTPSAPSNLLQELESIFNESMHEVHQDSPTTEPMLAFNIKEANQLCNALKKPFEFMAQEVLNENGLEMIVLVKDISHSMTATLSPRTFNQKLQILRDTLQGEEAEDESLESGVTWVRAEDVNRVPAFISRLRDSSAFAAFNLSLNSSINTSFAQKRPVKKRRSSILCPDRSGIFGSGGGSVAASGTVAVASAIHRTLVSLPKASPTAPPANLALEAAAGLNSLILRIRDHTTEPGLTLPDDEYNEHLVRLLCVSQTTNSSLSAVADLDITTNCARCKQLQEKLRKSSGKINNSITRLFQGVKNEVDSLVEEESRTILTLTKEVAKDIAELTLIASLPTPTIDNLDLQSKVCTKFLEGLKGGLDGLVRTACETSNAVYRCPVPCGKSGNASMIAAMRSGASAIGSFLRKFNHLDASFDHSTKIDNEEKRKQMVVWIARVESAAETIGELNKALNDVLDQVRSGYEGDMDDDVIEQAVEELKTRLEKLMCFAGLGSQSNDAVLNYSLSSSTDLDDSDVFMDTFQSVAWRAVHAVSDIKTALACKISGSGSSGLHTPVSAKLKFSMNQWPTNSRDYLQMRKTQLSAAKSPFKSSLRSSSSTPGDKRVRFNVSISPCVSSDGEDSIET